MGKIPLGFAVALSLAGVGATAGFGVFPPGRFAGLWPALTAWGPAAVVAAGVLGYWGAAVGALLASARRPAPPGEVLFASEGGAVMLAFAVMPLAGGVLFLAGAVEQLGLHAVRGVPWALASGVGGAGLLLVGQLFACTRTEVRLGGGVLTVVSGRGLPTTTSWRVRDIALEVTKVVTFQNTHWTLELVDAKGARRVLSRAWSQAEAEATAARIRAST